MRLGVEVVWGDIARAAADIVAVGHYQNVYPTQAEAALDRAMSGDAGAVVTERVLHGATARGVLTGSLGEVTLFPWDREGSPVMSAVVGLGRPGTFGLPQHEVLVRNLLWTAERVPGVRRVAAVLIGSGASNLSIAEATDSLVRALDAAVRARELTGAVTTVQIVEQELGRATQIHEALTQLVDARWAGEVNGPAILELAPLVVGVDGHVDDATRAATVAAVRRRGPGSPWRSIRRSRRRRDGTCHRRTPVCVGPDVDRRVRGAGPGDGGVGRCSDSAQRPGSQR